MPRDTSVMGEVTEEDLSGFPLKELKCRACSGYGNCGYRMYRLHEGKPVAICQMRRKELVAERDGADAATDAASA